MLNGIRQSLGLDLVYINVYTIFIKILRMKLEFGPGSFFRILTSAKPRPITIDNSSIPWTRACQYQCVCIFLFQNIPHRSRDRVSFFVNLDVGKASTNGK